MSRKRSKDPKGGDLRNVLNSRKHGHGHGHHQEAFQEQDNVSAVFQDRDLRTISGSHKQTKGRPCSSGHHRRSNSEWNPSRRSHSRSSTWRTRKSDDVKENTRRSRSPTHRSSRLNKHMARRDSEERERPRSQRSHSMNCEDKDVGNLNEHRSRESSLSLSLSPSPERSASPEKKRPFRSSHQRRPPDHREHRRRMGRFSLDAGYSNQHSSHHNAGNDNETWESKVNAFMNSITPKQDVQQEALMKEEEQGAEDGNQEKSEPLPPGLEDNDDEDMKSSPLIRYIGKKLTKIGNLKLVGVFQYNLVSLLTKGEWVAAKTLGLFEEFGYKDDQLYFIATAKGAPALQNELKTVVFSNKFMNKLGSKAEIVNSLVYQVLLVVDCIVKYFTASEVPNESDENTGAEEDNDTVETSGNAIRSGVGDLLKSLAGQADKEEQDGKSQTKYDQAVKDNPWTDVEDSMKSQSLKSLLDLKTYIGKDILRLDDITLCNDCPVRLHAFEVAQNMTVALVIAGYNHGYLQHLVIQTPYEEIFPPRDFNPSRIRRQTLYDKVLQQLVTMKAQFPFELTMKQLEYVVKKTLTYIMNGCNKRSDNHKNIGPCNVVFNYLPEGLREMENKNLAKSNDQSLLISDNDTVEEGGIPQVDMNNPENEISTDPLNAILNPEESKVKTQPNRLPKRCYMTGFFHLEWVVLNGEPQVFEINVYMSDMTSLNIYCIPDMLQRQLETVKNLGFVFNQDLRKFYFTDVGVGCIEALNLKQAMNKLIKFLDSKRNDSTSENMNNGLIMNSYSEEEVAIFLRLLDVSNKHLLIDTIKGFGCVEVFIERNRSKKMSFSGANLEVGGMETFYHTEVRKELKAKTLVSRSKGEALLQSLEFFLDESPNYGNYIQSYCFPSFSPRVEEIKRKLILFESMFPLEVFMASELNKLIHDKQLKLVFEGVFQPRLGKDLRDGSSIIANQFCKLLVKAGLDDKKLKNAYKNNPDFQVSKAVILDKMSEVQRWAVMEQTLRCVGIVKQYYREVLAAQSTQNDD